MLGIVTQSIVFGMGSIVLGNVVFCIWGVAALGSIIFLGSIACLGSITSLGSDRIISGSIVPSQGVSHIWET